MARGSAVLFPPACGQLPAGNFARVVGVPLDTVYFDRAHVWGMDISVQPQARDAVRDANSARLHLLPSTDSQDCGAPSRLRLPSLAYFYNECMEPAQPAVLTGVIDVTARALH